MAALEDKIVQASAVADVLNAIYEEDFLGFSLRIPATGGEELATRSTPCRRPFTPGKVNYIVDADTFAEVLPRTR